MPFKQQSYVAAAFKNAKCADCSAPGPTWASINRGVLVCGECFQVHCTLGRHISDIVSLYHAVWAPARLQLLQSLVQCGANKIWEHELSSGGKSSSSTPSKPGPNDKLRPNKEQFILAKYRDNRFCQRPDDITQSSLNSQLLLSVTQGALDSTLKLLAFGAEVNCRSSGGSETPLHLAASHDQLLQYELLTVYGANPTLTNGSNLTPYELARKCGFYQTANRILILQYELTDKLGYFISNKYPDHVNGEHITIPKLERSGTNVVEAQNKLRMLDNQSFEELAADIFDELDRRETEKVWKLSKNAPALDARFLPVNPSFSSLRNQGRQKLGTLASADMVLLVTHVLEEGKRRESIARPITHCSFGSTEDEPSYCDVPSEHSDVEEPLYDEGHSSPVYDQVPERDEYIDSKHLHTTQLLNQQKLINGLKEENARLRERVFTLEALNSRLDSENREFRRRLMSNSNSQQPQQQFNDYDIVHSSSSVSSVDSKAHKSAAPTYSNISDHSTSDSAKKVQQQRYQALPSIDLVTEKTTSITQAVTILRDAIRKDNLCRLPEVREMMLAASRDVAAIFPQNPQWQTVKLSLELLTHSALELSRLTMAGCNDDREAFIDRTVNLAKDIARAAKSLVVYVHQNANKSAV